MIIETIKQETGIDVTIKSRKREQVDFKTLASYVLKQKGYNLSEIGRQLNLKHCTIIHHLKIYPIVKQHNPRVKELESILLGGKKKNVIFDSLQLQLDKKNQEIKELKEQLNYAVSNKVLKRLLPLLDNENILEKLEAFIDINEKARYYKKYE